MVFQLTVKGHTTHEIERILHVSHGCCTWLFIPSYFLVLSSILPT